MPKISRYIGQTVAVMTECNRLVKVEFNELPGGDVELTLIKAGTFERVRGFGHQTTTAECYKAAPWDATTKAKWALMFFDLKVKEV